MMITMGVLSAPISDQAQMLRKQGLRFKDIAWEMAVSIDTVSSRLPYEDEIHGSDDAPDHNPDARLQIGPECTPEGERCHPPNTCCRRRPDNLF